MTPDYGSPQDAYIFTGPIPPPTMWLMGEIDDTTQVIPQPVHVDLSITGVMRAIDKGAEMPVERPSVVPRVPVWAVASVALGMVLMAFGLVLQDPLAMAVYEVIR